MNRKQRDVKINDDWVTVNVGVRYLSPTYGPQNNYRDRRSQHPRQDIGFAVFTLQPVLDGANDV